jgi:UDP-N-acetylglucosamine--dolichyl-phosphate N-acetylglucosaminephosphotransferase
VVSKKFLIFGISGIDIHKLDRPIRAEMGGLSIMVGFIGGISLMLIFSAPISGIILAGIVTIILSFCIGVYDDISPMRQRYKPLLIGLVTVPMILTYGPSGSLWLPIIGEIQLGLLYPFALIPLAVISSSNFANMLAGFNGLEAGIGVIGLSTLSFLSFVTGQLEVGVLALILTSAFVAFLKYNWYPAKIFPGDSGTLLYGASIAVIGILGKLEFAAIIISIPAALDFTLKMLHRRPFGQRREYGDTRINSEGILEPASYPALSHIFLRVSNLSEKGLVAIILGMEIIYSLIAILMTLLL